MKLSAGKYGLVLCEGREDAHVLMRIAEAAELKQLKIQDYQGKDNLAAYLKMLVKSSDFISGRIQRINFDWSHSAFSEISRLMYFCNQPAD